MWVVCLAACTPRVLLRASHSGRRGRHALRSLRYRRFCRGDAMSSPVRQLSISGADIAAPLQERQHRSNNAAKRCGRGQGEGAFCSGVCRNETVAETAAVVKRLSLPVLWYLSCRSKKGTPHAVEQTDYRYAVSIKSVKRLRSRHAVTLRCVRQGCRTLRFYKSEFISVSLPRGWSVLVLRVKSR